MDFFNTTFYDQESVNYSSKRYPKVVGYYFQYLFATRLALVGDFINRFTRKSNISILEDGCADGIVLRLLASRFPGRFVYLVGTDIAPKMIKVAKKKNFNAEFFLKDNFSGGKFDVVLALGFLSPSIFVDEFSFIERHLKTDGICICSLSGVNSLHARLKLRGVDYVSDYATYKKYKELLEFRFKIIAIRPYGFFVPKLWAFPLVARRLQPVMDRLFLKFFPELFHEQLFVLKLK